MYRSPDLLVTPSAKPALSRRLGIHLVLGLISLFAVAPAAAMGPDQVAKKPIQFTAKSDTVDLAGLEQNFRDIARRVAPSVVAITASSEPASAKVPIRSAELNGSMLERLLQGT